MYDLNKKEEKRLLFSLICHILKAYIFGNNYLRVTNNTLLNNV